MTTNANAALRGGSICFGKPGLTAGTTTTYTTGANFNYSIRGQMLTETAASNAASPTTDIVTGAAFLALTADRCCVFVFCVDSAGTVSVAQGPIATLSEVTGKLAAVHFPEIPSSLCPFGYLYAQGGTTVVGTWTFGTNNLSGVTGMTYTFRDLAILPASPITA
jgi:hypothetical protein